jgi:hypothetical protein
VLGSIGEVSGVSGVSVRPNKVVLGEEMMPEGPKVIYGGVYKSAERILRMVIEENADAVEVSFLGGEKTISTRCGSSPGES